MVSVATPVGEMTTTFSESKIANIKLISNKKLAKKNLSKARYNETLYEHTCWVEFNKIIKSIRKKNNSTQHEAYIDAFALIDSNHELSEMEQIHKKHEYLKTFERVFIQQCRTKQVPLSRIYKTHAFKSLCTFTRSYVSYTNLTGHAPNRPEIYYKKAQPNRQTKHHINKLSYIKLGLSQITTCGRRKVNNPPINLSCSYDCTKNAEGKWVIIE